MSELPVGWMATTLAVVADWGSGGTPSRRNSEFFNGSIPWIKTGELGRKFVKSAEEHISEEAIKKSSAKIFAAGSIGIAMYGATIGKLSIFGIDASTNQACAVANPKKGLLDKEFLYYYLLSERRALIDSGKGGAQPNISQGLLKEWPVALPPLNEQHRIVAKIEALFSELDKGIEALKTAREQLKIYRQAVLKHAFEGKLTAHWREDNKEKLESGEQLLARIQQERQARYQQQLEEWKVAVKVWEENGKAGKKPRKPKEILSASAAPEEEVSQLAELPAGWIYLRLGNFVSSIDAGKSFKCDERQPSEDEIGVAKVSAVSWGEYDEGQSKTCIDLEKVNTNYFINEGDFLLSRANTIELVGACVIAKKVTQPVMLSDKTLRLTFYACDQNYFLHYLRSHQGRNEIMKRSTGNQESMRNIGQDRIRSIIVPVCGNDEVSEVINQIESKVAQIDSLSAEIENQISRSETLRQSILKKVFSGQLVPQDPNDEPASALLQRIRAKKAVQTQSGSNSNNKKLAK